MEKGATDTAPMDTPMYMLPFWVNGPVSTKLYVLATGEERPLKETVP